MIDDVSDSEFLYGDCFILDKKALHILALEVWIIDELLAVSL